MLVVRCVYSAPWIGDVALLSALWHDNALAAPDIHHVHIPIVGGEAWWHWIDGEPALVQQALRTAYDNEFHPHETEDLW